MLRSDGPLSFLIVRSILFWQRFVFVRFDLVVFRLANKAGCFGVLTRLFRTRSVMGRLWDDHFRDLGYPPKFYRGQDAGFDSGSSS